jgi:hypothetical protein
VESTYGMMHRHGQAFISLWIGSQAVPEILTLGYYLFCFDASPPLVSAGEACRRAVHHRKLVVKAEYFHLETRFFLSSYLWRPSSSMSSFTFLIVNFLSVIFAVTSFEQLQLVPVVSDMYFSTFY